MKPKNPGRGMYYGDYLQDQAEQLAADFRYRQAILGEEASHDR